MQAMAFPTPILAGMSVGLSAIAEAAGRGQIETGADKLLHLPPMRSMAFRRRRHTSLSRTSTSAALSGLTSSCLRPHLCSAPTAKARPDRESALGM